MRNMPTCFAVCAIIAGTSALLALRPQEQRPPELVWQSLQPAVTFAGSYSQITEREYVRIHDPISWRTLWERHAGENAERDSYGEIVVPAINFDEFMVIGVFNGEAWNTRDMHCTEQQDGDELRIRFDAGTYQTADVELTEITIEGEATPEEVERRVLENMDRTSRQRDANKHNDPNYTSAYGLWVLPRNVKPIVLIENVQNMLGEPPIWKEQHRFERVKK